MALCEHVPETAAAQGCPAGCQACVRCVVPSPVLHHVHYREKETRDGGKGFGRIKKKKKEKRRRDRERMAANLKESN